MTIRLFKCRECGHRMRFAGTACGRCHTEKRVYQLPMLYSGSLTLIALAMSGLISARAILLH